MHGQPVIKATIIVFLTYLFQKFRGKVNPNVMISRTSNLVRLTTMVERFSNGNKTSTQQTRSSYAEMFVL